MKINVAPNKSGYCIISKSFSEWLKLFAISLVALGHFFQYSLNRGLEGEFYSVFVSQAGYLGVAIFFFLSGYGLSKNWEKHPQSFIQFLQKRLLKIIAPMILVSAFWIIVGALMKDSWIYMPQFQNYHLSVGEIIKILLYIDNGPFYDGTMWFMKVLLCLYIFFFIYQRSKFYLNRKWGGVILISMMYVSTHCVALWMQGWMSVSIPLFFIGIVFAENKVKSILPLLSLFLFVIVLIYSFAAKDSLLIHADICYLFIFLLICVTSCISVEFITIPSILRGCSMDIYLVHNKVRVVLFGMSNMPSIAIYIVGCVLCAVGFRFVRNKISKI